MVGVGLEGDDAVVCSDVWLMSSKQVVLGKEDARAWVLEKVRRARYKV